MQIETLCVKEPAERRTTAPHVLPLYATSSFAFENIDQGIDIFQNIETGHAYSRYANPTVDAVAEKIAALEGYGLDVQPGAVMTSSGMAAIATLLLGVLKQGDKVLTQANLYGGTTELFKSVFERFGIEVILTDLKDQVHLDELLRMEGAIRLVYCETPANPTLSCVDLGMLAELAHNYDAYLAVDNTFCTPLLQQPLAHGADFVVHSTTKYLNGHGNSTAGIVISRDNAAMRRQIWQAMKLVGTNCSPFEAWLTHNGLKTLSLRMHRHCSNALALAEYLETHPAVKQVNYPGLESHPDHALAGRQMKGGYGGMLSFELNGGFEAAVACMNTLELCTLAPTLGDVDTLVLHPASSSHLNVEKSLREASGISDGLIRVSVGIESAEDLIADFENAFDKLSIEK